MPRAPCPVPCALCPKPFALCPVLCAPCPVLCALCPVPRALCPGLGRSPHRAPHRAPGTAPIPPVRALPLTLPTLQSLPWALLIAPASPALSRRCSRRLCGPDSWPEFPRAGAGAGPRAQSPEAAALQTRPFLPDPGYGKTASAGLTQGLGISKISALCLLPPLSRAPAGAMEGLPGRGRMKLAPLFSIGYFVLHRSIVPF